METRYRYITFLLLFILGITACEKFELRGFVLSYESANERFHQSMAWNAAHPYKEIVLPVDNYVLYVMADSHVGGTRNLDSLLNDAMDANAAAVIMAGDLTTGHSEDYTTFKEHIPSHDSISTFPMVGNHDLYFDGWKHFRNHFGSSSYLFTIKTPEATDLFICLDSGSGTFGSDQLDWLRSILETERHNHRRCVLFTHSNFFRFGLTGATNPLVEELYVMLDLSVMYEIDMIVTGHDHDHSVEALGNTTYIVTGALEDGFDHAGYLILTVDQGATAYEFVNL